MLRSSLALFVGATLISLASTAHAQTATPDEGPSERAVMVRARMPGSVLFGLAPQAGPLLVAGVRLGRLDLGLGLTVTTFGVTQTRRRTGGFDPLTGMPLPGTTTTSDTTSGLLVFAGPAVNYAFYQSADRRGRAYVGGMVVFGTLGVSAGNSTSDDESAFIFGGMAHLGGEYHLGRMFTLGAEAGYGLLMGSLSGAGSSTSETSVNTTGTYVTLTGTLLLPL